MHADAGDARGVDLLLRPPRLAQRSAQDVGAERVLRVCALSYELVISAETRTSRRSPAASPLARRAPSAQCSCLCPRRWCPRVFIMPSITQYVVTPLLTHRFLLFLLGARRFCRHPWHLRVGYVSVSMVRVHVRWLAEKRSMRRSSVQSYQDTTAHSTRPPT